MAVKRRPKKRAVFSVDVGAELLEWLDGLGGKGGERANRSYHVRQALRWYQVGGWDAVQAKLEELKRRQAAVEPPNPHVERLGEWMLGLSTDVRALVYYLGMMVNDNKGLRPLMDVVMEHFARCEEIDRRERDSRESEDTPRTPKAAATRARRSGSGKR